MYSVCMYVCVYVRLRCVLRPFYSFELVNLGLNPTSEAWDSSLLRLEIGLSSAQSFLASVPCLLPRSLVYKLLLYFNCESCHGHLCMHVSLCTFPCMGIFLTFPDTAKHAHTSCPCWDSQQRSTVNGQILITILSSSTAFECGDRHGQWI